MHGGNPGILEAESKPHATGLAEVHVDAGVRKMLLVVVREGRAGHHVEPGVAIDVDKDDITIVRRGQESLVAGDIGCRGVVRGTVDEHTTLVHHQQVRIATGAGEGFLADTDEIDVPVLVNVTPGVVLLPIVVGTQRGRDIQPGGGLVVESKPALGQGGPGQGGGGQDR